MAFCPQCQVLCRACDCGRVLEQGELIGAPSLYSHRSILEGDGKLGNVFHHTFWGRRGLHKGRPAEAGIDPALEPEKRAAKTENRVSVRRALERPFPPVPCDVLHTLHNHVVSSHTSPPFESSPVQLVLLDQTHVVNAAEALEPVNHAENVWRGGNVCQGVESAQKVIAALCGPISLQRRVCDLFCGWKGEGSDLGLGTRLLPFQIRRQDQPLLCSSMRSAPPDPGCTLRFFTRPGMSSSTAARVSALRKAKTPPKAAGIKYSRKSSI